MKKTLLFTGIATLTAAPLIAQGMMGHEGHDMMAPEPMTRTDVAARVKAHFAEMDANKDGAVTLAEIDAARETHMAKMRDEMFNQMDADKDGSISRAEFEAHHQHMMAGGMAPPPPMAGGDMRHEGPGHGRMGGRGDGGRWAGGPDGGMERRMFTMADANQDGQVTEAEATQAALTRFDKVDTNKDGTISAAEHKAAREKMRAAWKAKKVR